MNDIKSIELIILGLQLTKETYLTEIELEKENTKSPSGEDIKTIVKEQKHYTELKSSMNRALKMIKEIENIQDSQITKFIENTGMDRITVNGMNFRVKELTVASCSGSNYDKFIEHVQTHPEHQYLIQRRLNSAAALEAIKLDGEIPGIEIVTLNKLSKTKA